VRVLVAEDDPAIASWLSKVLREDGHVADHARTAHEAEGLAATSEYALAIVDLGLPDRSGVSLIRALRREGGTMPVMVFSGNGHDAAVIAALDAGADDFLVKPVSVAILRARVRAATRRGQARAAPDLALGSAVLDRVTRRLRTPGGDAELSTQEFVLLELFLQRPDEVITRSAVLAHVWGAQFEPGTNRVDVAVSRLRQKLASAEGSIVLEAVRGVGYRLRLRHADDGMVTDP
jgi:two-component system, OmpR family, response regulator